MNSFFFLLYLQGRKIVFIISNLLKLLGIGFNYVVFEEKLKDYNCVIDLVSFLKFVIVIIGSDDSIYILKQFYKIMVEVELVVVIGEMCKDIESDEVINVIVGYMLVIDVIVVDIYVVNYCYLM